MAVSKIKLADFLAVYGKLITDTQREIVEMYCNCDCTLSEIGEEKNITRQGVRDAILKAEASFEKMEECLHLSEFVRSVNLALNDGDDGKIAELAKSFVTKE